jgi:hypothetical protein
MTGLPGCFGLCADRVTREVPAIRNLPNIDCGALLADEVAQRQQICERRHVVLQIADLEHARSAFAENAMLERSECHCIYVEISNDRVPRSGRIEYRAMLCAACRARDELLPGDLREAAASEIQVPRYQRMH